MRGMAASSKLMGNYKKAITYLERVLEVRIQAIVLLMIPCMCMLACANRGEDLRPSRPHLQKHGLLPLRCAGVFRDTAWDSWYGVLRPGGAACRTAVGSQDVP